MIQKNYQILNVKCYTFEIIKSSNVGIGIADVECIDSINILNATKYAMNLARVMLSKKPDMLLIDGNFIINNKNR